MKIKAPKSVPVGGHNYKVEQDPSLALTKGNRGQCDNAKETITIDSNAIPSHKTTILLHEVLEAIKFVWFDNDLDHHTLDTISEGIFQFLGSLGIEIEWDD